MAYAHAVMLTEDQTSTEIRLACNADAQHWPKNGGPYCRRLRAELVIRRDGYVARMLT